MRLPSSPALAATLALALAAGSASADEHLFGYVRGSETLPQGSYDVYPFVTQRSGKGSGHYRATDYLTEVEYGLTHRLTVSGGLKLMSLSTRGLLVDGYLPGDKSFGLKPAGFMLEAKYNILSPAKDDFGLSTSVELTHNTLDPHSGQKKNATKLEFGTQMQKYFAEGQLVWAGNGAVEATYARRKPIANLPEGFEWSTDPEVEIEVKLGTGLSYRVAPGWFLGGEAQYETEYETEVGQERWSVFGGPSLHYASKQWWMTLTWFKQLRGGGEAYEGQPAHRYLIEKTNNEVRLKLGLNF